MVVTSKGQVTIPKKLREQLGILPHTEVEFEVVDDSLRLRPIRSQMSRGSTLIARMRGKASTSMTTDEIMSLTREDEWQ